MIAIYLPSNPSSVQLNLGRYCMNTIAIFVMAWIPYFSTARAFVFTSALQLYTNFSAWQSRLFQNAKELRLRFCNLSKDITVLYVTDTVSI